MNVAAVDIGSNSVRLLILTGNGVELAREATVTALGRGLSETLRFQEESIEATLRTIVQYQTEMQKHDVTRVAVVATSASRDASNADELMLGVENLLGVRPEVISGQREAAFSFAGATMADTGHPPHLVIDIGGGSTEFVFGETHPTYSVSLDVGTVRLSEKVLSQRPASVSQLVDAEFHIEDAFSDVSLPGIAESIIGVAGTFTSLAAIDLDLAQYESSLVHGSVLTVGAITRLIHRLAPLTVEQTAAIPSLDPGRAPVLLAGALIAAAALSAVGASEVRVSEHDLLDGLAGSLL